MSLSLCSINTQAHRLIVCQYLGLCVMHTFVQVYTVTGEGRECVGERTSVLSRSVCGGG